MANGCTSLIRSISAGCPVLPDGIKGWMVKLDANPDGGMSFIQLLPRFGDQRLTRSDLKAMTPPPIRTASRNRLSGAGKHSWY